jgi:hypothetical protein
MRVGNKKPAMSVTKTVKTGTDKSSNTSAHVATGNKTVTGGTGVHGMPLMSAAAPKVKY